VQKSLRGVVQKKNWTLVTFFFFFSVFMILFVFAKEEDVYQLDPQLGDMNERS
jgi:hypothetical protein